MMDWDDDINDTDLQTEHPRSQSRLEHEFKVDSSFDIFVPKLVQTTNFRGADSSVSCRGCGQTFTAKLHKNRRTKLIPSIEFFHHCLKECQEYRGLGIHRRCWKCRKLFMGETNYIYHLRSYKECKSFASKTGLSPLVVEPEPCNSDVGPVTSTPISSDRTSVGLKVLCSRNLNGVFEMKAAKQEPLRMTVIACPGLCGQVFDCQSKHSLGSTEKDVRDMMSSEMICHMIQCPEYLSLGKGVESCVRCQVTFPDSQSFSFHQTYVCPFLP